MKISAILLSCLLIPAPSLPGAEDSTRQRPTVLTGIDVLIRQQFAPLKGKKVGLVTNPTGVTSDLKATADVLASAPGVTLVALFGPEHGVRGDALAGETVANAKDPRTGLPVYSLYGKTKKPTASMLRGLDALVFDMQDIGSRSYTYITTMGLCMEAAADAGIPFYVLDRPNPIGGERIEGNLVEAGFKSGVSPYPIPYCHGLTLGELAQMLNGQGMLAGARKCELHVIQMQGYRRSMRWEQTGLPWVPTSPHIPKPETAYFYAATGITGELPTVSIGVGYTLPFELFGAPGVSPSALADELNRRRLSGLHFRPVSYRPFYAVFQGKTCGGVQIYLTDPDRAELTRLNFELLDALRKTSPRTLFPSSSTSVRLFDLVCGTDRVRKMLLAGRSSSAIWSIWNSASSAFRSTRKPYLIYP
jgi:uncharacterized protein YbbC (DUF1343 family)